jgi:hypothetical protein
MGSSGLICWSADTEKYPVMPSNMTNAHISNHEMSAMPMALDPVTWDVFRRRLPTLWWWWLAGGG